MGNIFFLLQFSTSTNTAFLLEMEILAKRVSCKVEHEPLHPPIYQKIHLQPDLITLRHFNYTTSIIENFCCNGALVNRRSQGPVLPVSEGSAVTSVVKPSPPALAGGPMGNNTGSMEKQMVLIGVMRMVYAPFERMKLLMQNQNAIIKSGRLLRPYNGVFDCFASTIRNEGIFSLWRGNIALSTAFVSSKLIRLEILKYALSRKENEGTFMRILVFCCVTKAATLLLVYPFSYAGTRMATDVKTIPGNMGSRQFTGTLDVFRKTLKSDGISGLYRGYSVTLLAEISLLGPPSMGLRAWKYSILNQFQRNDPSRHALESGFGFFERMAFYPFDTVSSRMMMTSGGVKYKSARHAISEIWKTEGGKSFYSGLGAEILATVGLKSTIVVLFTIYLAHRAAKNKADDDDGSPSSFSVRWKLGK